MHHGARSLSRRKWAWNITPVRYLGNHASLSDLLEQMVIAKKGEGSQMEKGDANLGIDERIRKTGAASSHPRSSATQESTVYDKYNLSPGVQSKL